MTLSIICRMARAAGLGAGASAGMSAGMRAGISAGLMLALAAAPASAFQVFTYGTDQALKWGSANTVGTPGGVVTWSLMADGTPLDALAPAGLGGSSSLGSVFAQVGGQAVALSMIQQAFDAWQAVAHVQFLQVTESGPATAAGAATATAGGVIGQIRIGAYSMPGFTGAVGFAPPPNGGTTLEGDIYFNAANTFGIAPGSEGDPYTLFPAPGFTYLNDFQGLFTHELGHALGLDHSGVATAMMCGHHPVANPGTVCDYLDNDGVPDGLAHINRLPDADDIAGIQFLYGVAPVPEPGGAPLLMAGLGALAAAHAARRRVGAGQASPRPSRRRRPGGHDRVCWQPAPATAGPRPQPAAHADDAPAHADRQQTDPPGPRPGHGAAQARRPG